MTKSRLFTLSKTSLTFFFFTDEQRIDVLWRIRIKSSVSSLHDHLNARSRRSSCSISSSSSRWYWTTNLIIDSKDIDTGDFIRKVNVIHQVSQSMYTNGHFSRFFHKQIRIEISLIKNQNDSSFLYFSLP